MRSNCHKSRGDLSCFEMPISSAAMRHCHEREMATMSIYVCPTFIRCIIFFCQALGSRNLEGLLVLIEAHKSVAIASFPGCLESCESRDYVRNPMRSIYAL